MKEIELLKPPVGLNVFVVAGSVKNLKAGQVFRRIWLFVVAELVLIAILLAWPQIILLLHDISSTF